MITPDPILPQVAAELEQAAKRRIKPSTWRLRSLPVIAVTAAGLSVTAGAFAVTGVFDDRPSRPYQAEPPEPGLTYERRPVALARTPVRADGRRFEVVGYRLGRRDATLPATVCLDIVLLPERTAHGCLSPDEYVQGRTTRSDGRFTMEGAAEVEVRRVQVSYRSSRGRGQRTATLVYATDRTALAKVGIDTPFAVWRAALPAGSRRLRVRAYDASGTRLWEARDPLEHDAAP